MNLATRGSVPLERQTGKPVITINVLREQRCIQGLELAGKE